ncbi:MAG: AfsR/SARP family transcriptional regulator [Dermatophilaceae bacterium]
MPSSAVLTVKVLGPVQVHRDGVLLTVPSGKTTELLVRLALQARRPVRAERLIDDLWPGPAVAVSRNTLQAKVSSLRRALGAADLVRATGSGYLLDVDPGAVDALEVGRLADTAVALRRGDDPAGALHVSGQALTLFSGEVPAEGGSGEVLPDGGDGEWLLAHRARLEETRLRLSEERIAARIDLGDDGDLGELEGLVAQHPLRESLWLALITVLYRAGRQADALAAYRRVQRRLHDELGIAPGPALRAMEGAVLRQDRGLEGPALNRQQASPSPRGNLPALSGLLVGRDADVDEVCALVSSHRLVTLVGTAGVGKSRLAIEVARRCQPAGGSWLVRLDGADGATAAWRAIGEALGVGGASTEAVVLERIRTSQLLVVLDSCEHLGDRIPALVERLFRAAPALRVLATSQVALGLEGELARPVAPLGVADSVTLFTRLARGHRASFRVDAESVALVQSVCRSLDGLPLAIELAAARAKTLSVQQIARRLDDRFALLTDPTGRHPARHRALRAALSWSYELLFPDDQRGLWALACFADGATLEALENVLAALAVPPAATLDVVTRLADRSLLDVEVSPDGAVRYRLLDSVKQLGLERLGEAGLEEAARQAHATWLAAAARRVARGVRGPGQAEHLTFVRAERANVDAALGWAHLHDPVVGLRLATDLGWAWAVLGVGPDGARRLRDAVRAAARHATAHDRASGLLLAGWLEASGGNLEQAVADLDAGMLGDDIQLRSMGELYLAFVRSQQGRGREALELLASCRAQFHSVGMPWEEGASWLLAAWAHIVLGDTATARTACDEAVRLLEPIGDQWALNHAEGMLGGLAQAEHRYGDAVEHLRRAADATHRLGFAAAEAHHLANLGRALEQGGDRAAAAAALWQAIAAAEHATDLRTAALARVRLARVLRADGDREMARALVSAARAWYAAAGGGDATVLAQYLTAALAADAAEPGSIAGLEAALVAAREAGDVEVEVLTLDTLARVHAEAGRADLGHGLLETASTLAPVAAHLLSEADRIDRDRAVRLLEGR